MIVCSLCHRVNDHAVSCPYSVPESTFPFENDPEPIFVSPSEEHIVRSEN